MSVANSLRTVPEHSGRYNDDQFLWHFGRALIGRAAILFTTIGLAAAFVFESAPVGEGGRLAAIGGVVLLGECITGNIRLERRLAYQAENFGNDNLA